MITAPGHGEGKAARVTLEQGHAQMRLQQAHLLRHRPLGHAQFLGRGPEIQMAACGVEGAQTVERRNV